MSKIYVSFHVSFLSLIHIGRADYAKCFHCSCVVFDWLPNDNILDEHFRWSPSCSFINRLMDVRDAEAEKLRKNLRRNGKRLARRFDLADEQERQLTFAKSTSTSRSIKSRAKTLAAAGLYALEDSCSCWWCGYTLHSLGDDDDIVSEHVKMSPNCEFANDLFISRSRANKIKSKPRFRLFFGSGGSDRTTDETD